VFLLFAAEATLEVLVNGQVTWLLLLPVTLIWLSARNGKWTRAGIFLGIVASIKPFLLILLPYFVLERRWRGVLAAGISGMAMFALGVLVFGVDNHRAWVACLGQSDQWAWWPNNAGIWGAIFERTLAPNPFFQPIAELPYVTAKLISMLITGSLCLLTLALTRVDNSPERLDRAFALLLIGSVLFSPLGWIYYLWLPLPALAALMVTWKSRAADTENQTWWTRNWRFVLIGIAVAAQLLPAKYVRYFQPSEWATLTLGNIYFWSTLLVWVVLMIDGWLRIRGKVHLFGFANRTRIPQFSPTA
jgi:hypothetical protein